MGSALPLNEGNEEISLSRLGEKRVSSTENLENGDFQKFDDNEWFDGGESLKKTLCLQKSSGAHSFLLVTGEPVLDYPAINDSTKDASVGTCIFQNLH